MSEPNDSNTSLLLYGPSLDKLLKILTPAIAKKY
jgi:hypothetical protein